jgi:hypothetical protein
LFLTPGGAGFVPPFSPSVLFFELSVPYSTSQVTVTAETFWPQANISWALGFEPLAILEQGIASPFIQLAVGDQIIRVRSLAEDGIAFQTVTITVHRGLHAKLKGSDQLLRQRCIKERDER